MVNRAMMSSKRDDWATPAKLFAALHAEFGFTLDVAASHANAKCGRYYTVEQDGLACTWTGVVWCNPPYGRQIGRWVEKAARAAATGAATVVLLLPARTDTRWFHQWCAPLLRPGAPGEVRFLPGRLYFDDGPGRALFPSMVVVMRRAT